MAAIRESYTFRASLSDSMWDLVVNTSAPNSQVQIHREFTVRTIVSSIVGFLVYLYLILDSPVSHGGLGMGMILFTIGYFWLLSLLVMPTNTRLLGVSYIKPIMNYVNHDYRYVSTRSAMPAAPFMSIMDIKGVTNSGDLVFQNDDIGQILELSGNASVLMFAADTNLMLRNVQAYYRNVHPGVSLTQDNASAPQRVTNQLEAKDIQRADMIDQDPDLVELLSFNRHVIQAYVGRKFKALHQYLIVRAVTEDDLDTFMEWLRQQTADRESDSYLRGFRKLENVSEINDYLHSIYSASDIEALLSDNKARSAK